MTNDWDVVEEEDEEFGPGDPDYDLSEAHGYMWESDRDPSQSIPPWLLVTLGTLLIMGLVLPGLLIFLRYS